MDIESAKHTLQLLQLFDGKLSYNDIEEMDLPQLAGLTEARIQIIKEQAEAVRNAK
jgi:hypothetical protein